MQMGRLFEIVYILLNRDHITAGELSERFGVSVRTIYRDLDALSAAGIPVYAARGRNGGIRLMEGYVLNKSLLSEQDQREILASLQALQAVQGVDGDAVEKMSLLFRKSPDDWVSIDFSDWGSEHKERFHLLKSAVLSKECIAFDYHSMGKATRRTAEPLQLRFRHRAWYLLAFCRHRQDFRLFKISRMRNVSATGEFFERSLPDEVSEPAPGQNAPYLELTMQIDASQAYRVYDEFSPQQIAVQPDGSFLVTAGFIEDDWVYGYLMSFGPTMKVLAPERTKTTLKLLLKKSLEQYF